MSDTPETEKDEIGILIDKLDELITESIQIHKLERERDEAREKLDESESVMKWATEKVEELNKGLIRLVEERDEARRERDEAVRMLGEQLYQRVGHWTEEFERLLGELNSAREEVSVLKARLKEEA